MQGNQVALCLSQFQESHWVWSCLAYGLGAGRAGNGVAPTEKIWYKGVLPLLSADLVNISFIVSSPRFIF